MKPFKFGLKDMKTGIIYENANDFICLANRKEFICLANRKRLLLREYTAPFSFVLHENGDIGVVDTYNHVIVKLDKSRFEIVPINNFEDDVLAEDIQMDVDEVLSVYNHLRNELSTLRHELVTLNNLTVTDNVDLYKEVKSKKKCTPSCKKERRLCHSKLMIDDVWITELNREIERLDILIDKLEE